jgi:TonB family protein
MNKVFLLFYIMLMVSFAAQASSVPNVYAIDISTTNLKERNIEYAALLKEMLQDNFFPPKSKSHIQRVFKIQVETDGSISEVYSVSTSGVESFDQAALTAINALNPLPAPDKMRRIELTFENNIPWNPKISSNR